MYGRIPDRNRLAYPVEQFDGLRREVFGDRGDDERRRRAMATARLDKRPRSPIHKRDDVTGDADFNVRLQKYAIRETQELKAAVHANSDLQLIAQISDPVELARIVEDALRGNHPEHIARVGRAVEHKLSALARDEAQHTQSGDATPTAATWMQIAQQLRQWREREAERSPEVRRQRILDRQQTRVNALREDVFSAAEQFGINVAKRLGITRHAHVTPGEQLKGTWVR